MDHVEDYKVVVLGAGGVGKSSLIIQFIKQMFCEDYDPTVEDAYCKKMDLDGERITVNILDTAGQGAFSAMRDEYIHNGEGFLLVYSVQSRDSYMEISTFHRQITRVKDNDCFPCMIVEAMCDLVESEYQEAVAYIPIGESEYQEVAEGQGESLADQFNSRFVRTSAKCRVNIDQCFHTLLRLMREWKKKQEKLKHRRSRCDCCVLL